MTIWFHFNHKFKRIHGTKRVTSTRPGLVVKIINDDKDNLSLPILIKWQYKKFAAISMAILGLVMTIGQFLFLLLISHHNYKFTLFHYCLVCFFLLAGVGLFYGGIYASLYFKKIEIGNEEVIIERNVMFKKEKKHELANNYTRILCEIEQRNLAGSTSISEYLRSIYIIKLEHKDREKNLVIYQSFNKTKALSLLAQFCRLLNLPALS